MCDEMFSAFHRKFVRTYSGKKQINLAACFTAYSLATLDTKQLAHTNKQFYSWEEPFYLPVQLSSG